MANPIRRGLRLLALLVLIVTLGLWLWGGAHTGWTQTSVEVMREDPITGIEYPERVDRFMAGVEVLAGGLGLSLVLFGASFLVQRGGSRSNP